MAAPNLDDVIRFLLDTPMFGDLEVGELSQLVEVMEVRQVAADSWVFREGDPGDAWYVVYEGEVGVTKSTGAVEAQQLIAVLGPRTCFGEMAILDGSPRSASVKARRDCTVFRFARQAFNELLDSETLSAYKLVYQMALVLVSRQRHTTARLAGLMREETGGMRDGLSPLVQQSSVAE